MTSETPPAPGAQVYVTHQPALSDVRVVADAYLAVQAYLRTQRPLISALNAVRGDHEKPELRQHTNDRYLTIGAYDWFMDRFMARFSEMMFPQSDNEIPRWLEDFTATSPHEALRTLQDAAKKITAPELQKSCMDLLGLLTNLEQKMDTLPSLRPKATLTTETTRER